MVVAVEWEYQVVAEEEPQHDVQVWEQGTEVVAEEWEYQVVAEEESQHDVQVWE